MSETDLPASGGSDPIQVKIKVKTTLLDRFVERIKSSFLFFQAKPETDIQLIGRIQDLKKRIFDVLSQLKSIKNKIKNDFDPELSKFIEAIIEFLLKDIERIEKSSERQTSVSQQAHSFQKYAEWLEKAKFWVTLCSQTKDKKNIQIAVVEHNINEVLDMIERDLQIIHDYMEHMIDNLSIDEKEKKLIFQTLETRLNPYIKSLKALKIKPSNIDLKGIIPWKAQVDKRREKYFDGALHAIDKIITDINPLSTSDESHDHLVDILSQIAYLEEEVPRIYQEIIESGTIDEIRRGVIRLTLNTLQEEVHQLNLDLRLTPELIDRLQTISDNLDNTQKLLNSL